jgi:RNA polymerase sigma-70 factor (ECF subfamily)
LREESGRVDQQIVRAAGGDRAALESVLLHFHDPLLGFIKGSLCRSASSFPAPDDLLQETLIEAFRQAKHIEPRGTEAFFAWLKTIARTRQANMIKARGALKRGGGRARVHKNEADATATSILNLLAGDEPTPSRVMRGKEAFEAVHRALDGLEPDRRQMVQLRYGQGLSLAQVAAKTGRNLGAVKMLIHRAVRELREVVVKDYSAGA